MTPIERELHRAKVKNKKERLPGIHNEVCLGCGCDLTQGNDDWGASRLAETSGCGN
jgi:hypothetical protein